jgi:hypothetical protein
VTRVTAIIGAVFVFAVVFFVLDFFVGRFDGNNWIIGTGMAISAVLAFVAAATSYRATMKRATPH